MLYRARPPRTFNVSVQLALAVQVVEPAQDLAQNDSDVGFVERAWLHQVER